MVMTWLFCIAAFAILPFRLVNREVTLYGFVVLAAFIGAFCVGALLKSRPEKQRPWHPAAAANFKNADRIMKIVASVAIAAFMYEIATGNFFDLADSFKVRSDRAQALLIGAESDSSLMFQIGFLCYPVSFVFLVREIAFKAKPDLRNLAVFGIAPVAMASIAMGGRAPLLYALILIAYAFAVKKQVTQPTARARTRAPRRRMNISLMLALGIVALVGLNYFVKVFYVRAEVAGGVPAMFEIAASVWGISFDGFLSKFLFSILGEGNTYLLFIFAWYIVQGLVMSNVLFTSYDGPLHLGIYGIDLAAAVMRRVNGEFVAERFLSLLHLNTYGFLPSAFGSLYVDLGLFGLIICGLWGYWASMVYKNVKMGLDARWLLAVPFVNMGVLFSLINTPIGFSNGLMTHFWLVVILICTPRAAAACSPLASPPPIPQLGTRHRVHQP